jgi:WD40 repeat protein
MKRILYITIIWMVFIGFSFSSIGQNQNLPDIIVAEWDNHGNRLALGYEGGQIIILDVMTEVETSIGELTTGNILSVDWHPTQDNLILIGSHGPYWRIYDVSNNRMLYYGDADSASVTNVRWNVDGTLIASAANWIRDNTKTPRVDIWDATNCNLAPYEYNTYTIMGCQLITSFNHSGYINDVQWHPTDPYKLAVANDRELTRFWDIHLNSEYRIPIVSYNGSGTAIWNHDGSQIAIAQGGKETCAIGVWYIDELTEEPLKKFDIECYRSNVAWKSDGSLAISGSFTFHITDVEAREIFETFELVSQNEPQYVNYLDWSVNGDLVIGGTNDTLLYFTPNTYYIIDEASDFARFIEMANANTSMNVFDVRGDFELTAPLPDITGDITIIGNGATITMTGGNRIFNVLYNQQWSRNGSLTLKNVTLSGGIADEGGAIYNAGDLTLENVTLQNHSAVRGGAIYNTGNLVMNGGVIQNNTATEFGGGIYNLGDMQLDGVTIRQNTAPEGSGVYQGQ